MWLFFGVFLEASIFSTKIRKICKNLKEKYIIVGIFSGKSLTFELFCVHFQESA